MRASSVQLLWGVALVCALLAIVVRVWPSSLPSPAVEPVGVMPPDSAHDASTQAAAILSFEKIVQSNVFAEDRRPPLQRFVPPDMAVAASASEQPSTPDLRLYGLATGPAGAVALIDADPTIPGAEIYRIGDRVGVYRLESVTDSFVVLTDGAERRLVRLQSTAGAAR